MKVIVVGPQYPDSFARNISVTLSGMGHQTVNLDGVRPSHHRGQFTVAVNVITKKFLPKIQYKRFAHISEVARQFRPDLVLVTIPVLPPEVVRDVKTAAGVPVVCWYTDPSANVYRFYLVACDYDAIFVKEPFLVTALRNNLGLNAHYLPEACNPLWHTKPELSDNDVREYGCDLAGAGSLHYYRAKLPRQDV